MTDGTVSVGKHFFGDAEVKQATLHLSVTRADGRVEDLGIVAAYRPSVFQRLKLLVRRVISKAV